jgi:hypothetical protein
MEGKVVMFTNANTATASIAAPGLRRRSLLGMVVVGATPLSWRAFAAAALADQFGRPTRKVSEMR